MTKKKYANKTTIEYFLGKLREKFANKTDTTASLESIEVEIPKKGEIKTVNGTLMPDADGNVQLTVASIGALDGSAGLPVASIEGETLIFGKVVFDRQENRGVFEWDGNMDGKTTVEYGSFTYCLISEIILTTEDFSQGATATILFGGEEEHISSVCEVQDNGLVSGGGPWIYSPSDGLSYDGNLYPKRGLYFVNGNSGAMICKKLVVHSLQQN